MITLFRNLTVRYWRRRWLRSLVTLLGIALGVTMVVAVELTNGAIMSSYETLLAGVAGRADLQVTSNTGQGFPSTLLADVEAVKGVKSAVPSVSSSSPVLFADKKGVATIYGVDPAKDGLVRDYKLIEGHQVGRGQEIALTTEAANGLGLKLSDKVKLLSTVGWKDFTVVGVFEAKGTVRGTLGPFAVVPLAEAQQTFGKEGKFDTIDLLVADNATKDSVEKSVADRLSGRARVGTPLERSKDMQKLLDSVIFSLTFASLISLFAGAFIIYTNVSKSIADRRRDLSILRAVGLRRWEVMALVFAEAGSIGLVGAGLGLLWGYGLSSAMTQQLTSKVLTAFGVQAAQVSVGMMDIITALAVGVGISLVAVYGPANETTKFSPVDAMRPEDIQAASIERHGLARVFFGLALIAAPAIFIWATWPKDRMLEPWVLRVWGISDLIGVFGLVVLLPVLLPLLNRYCLEPIQTLLFGVPGRLASDNLVRRPRRTSATVAALTISLMFMVGMGGLSASQSATFEDWYNKRVGWDLNASTSFVGTSAQVGMASSMVKEMESIPGVKLVSPQNMGPIILSDGGPAYYQAFDYRLLRQYSSLALVEGDELEAFAAMERGGAVIISPSIARRLVVKLGDNLTLPTPTGDQAFKVVGVMKDVQGFGGTVEIARQDYVRYWQDDTVSNVAVVVNDPSQLESVRQSMLNRWGQSAGLIVRSNKEFWNEIKSYYESFYGLLDGLTWIATLVAGLAIANTLFSNILERKREFGILRAVGTRRREVMWVVLGEALSTGLIGGFFGVLSGLLTQTLFVASTEFINGSSFDQVFPWASVAQALVVALVLAPLVGLIPARWAARLDIVDALRYE